MSAAEHRNFVERLRLASDRVKAAVRADRGRFSEELAEKLVEEVKAAQGVVRRVSFVQHRASVGQSTQLRVCLGRLERELLKALQKV